MVALNNYEGMFLLDNRFASKEWTECEADIATIFEKHGGKMMRSRRWGERKLCYEINGHKRATYMLVYFQMPPSNISALLRELELSEKVIRNLIQFRDSDQMQSLLEAEDVELQRLAEIAMAEATRLAESAAAKEAAAAQSAQPAEEAPESGDTPQPTTEIADAAESETAEGDGEKQEATAVPSETEHSD